MADARIRELLRQVEPALTELRTRFGVELGGKVCPGGCDPKDVVAWDGFPQLIAGDLWQVHGCKRCLRTQAVRRYLDDCPLPTTLAIPTADLWIPSDQGTLHRMYFTSLPLVPNSTLRTACGWQGGWPDAPVAAIRAAHGGRALGNRCGSCERAVIKAGDCRAHAHLIWDELVERARGAIAEAGHPDPWGAQVS